MNVRELGEKLHITIKANAFVPNYWVPYNGNTPQSLKRQPKDCNAKESNQEEGEDTSYILVLQEL